MKKFKIQVIIFVVALSFIIAPGSYASNTDQNSALDNLLKSTTFLPIQRRIEILSNYFINVPYLLEPLGEGDTGQFNEEPLYRYDKFDCQTYVSTVLALAISPNLQAFKHNIQLIDYHNGRVSFITRNHFTDCDWVPHNIQQGFVKDINQQIAGKDIVITSTLIDKKNWLQHLTSDRIHINHLTEQQLKFKLMQLHQLSKKVNNQQIELQYIPATALFIGQQKVPSPIFNNIPSGAIILIIHPITKINSNDINGNTIVVHMGITVRYNKQLYIREASSYFGRVVDIPLVNYLLYVNPISDQQGISLLLPIAHDQLG